MKKKKKWTGLILGQQDFLPFENFVTRRGIHSLYLPAADEPYEMVSTHSYIKQIDDFPESASICA